MYEPAPKIEFLSCTLVLRSPSTCGKTGDAPRCFPSNVRAHLFVFCRVCAFYRNNFVVKEGLKRKRVVQLCGEAVARQVIAACSCGEV